MTKPSFYVAPKKQLERVKQLNKERKWGFTATDFPDIPEVKLSGTELLLLAVYLPDKGKVSGISHTFEEHVAVIKEQLESDDKSFWRWDDLKSDAKHLRLVKGITHTSGLRWVVFDYAAHHDPDDGHKVESLWNAGDTNLASSEVLSALMLFPEYASSMDGGKVPYANLPGYQAYYQSGWSLCPCVGWWSDDRQLLLHADWADDRYYEWASPVVRDCSELGTSETAVLGSQALVLPGDLTINGVLYRRVEDD